MAIVEIINPSPETLRPVTAHQSVGVTARPLHHSGGLAVTTLRVAPGGEIGSHPAPVAQLLLITAGGGQVRSGEGAWQDVTVGDAVRWSPGESHTTRSAGGLTAVAIEFSGP
jgi:quercetin dioxygenase-like cupin family protein